jgi:hypothetical protein
VNAAVPCFLIARAIAERGFFALAFRRGLSIERAIRYWLIQCRISRSVYW